MTDLNERADACIEGRGWFTNAERGELIRELRAENERLRAEVEALRRDAERLDWLDTLTKRTAAFGHNNRVSPLSSDMHFSKNSVALYLRTGIGSDYSSVGYADSVREAIDAAMQQENPR